MRCTKMNMGKFAATVRSPVTIAILEELFSVIVDTGNWSCSYPKNCSIRSLLMSCRLDVVEFSLLFSSQLGPRSNFLQTQLPTFCYRSPRRSWSAPNGVPQSSLPLARDWTSFVLLVFVFIEIDSLLRIHALHSLPNSGLPQLSIC